MPLFTVHSEGPKDEVRTTTLEAEDKDEARFIVEGQNRDLAKSDLAPESKPYRIARVETA